MECRFHSGQVAQVRGGSGCPRQGQVAGFPLHVGRSETLTCRAGSSSRYIRYGLRVCSLFRTSWLASLELEARTQAVSYADRMAQRLSSWPSRLEQNCPNVRLLGDQCLSESHKVCFQRWSFLAVGSTRQPKSPELFDASYGKGTRFLPFTAPQCIKRPEDGHQRPDKSSSQTS